MSVATSVLKTKAVSETVELAYLDSGAPPDPASYTTFVVVHGIHFTAPIFNHLLTHAPAKGVRVVAINRRGFKGSTPFTEAETALITAGGDAERSAFLAARGVEVAMFVDALIRDEGLPEAGGVALVGWSLGAMLTCAAVANTTSLPAEVQDRLARHLRAHILEDAPSVVLGLPLPPQIYSPQTDMSIPEAERHPRFMSWITAYFTHRDLSGADPSTGIEYVHPETGRAPAITRMSAEEQEAIVDMRPELVQFEIAMMLSLFPALALASFKAAMFDRRVKERLPRLRVAVLVGEATASFAISALWSIQAEEKATGEMFVDRYEVVSGANHFMHWDDPEITLDAFLRSI